MFLGDGTALFDRLGPDLTPVDFTAGRIGAAAAAEARARGIPVRHLPVGDPGVREVWERDLVLVRPDHHVAWRGDTVPDHWRAMLDVVRGAR